jgi:hypothetical protein
MVPCRTCQAKAWLNLLGSSRRTNEPSYEYNTQYREYFTLLSPDHDATAVGGHSPRNFKLNNSNTDMGIGADENGIDGMY